jgi:hypothetical protein
VVRAEKKVEGGFIDRRAADLAAPLIWNGESR